MKYLGFLAILITILLAGCGLVRGQPTPLPTVVLSAPGATPSGAATPQTTLAQPAGGEVTASGVVVPAQQAQIAPAQGGRVDAVLVQAGDAVRAGQPLVRMAGAERLSAAVEAARAELMAAQQAVQALKDNAPQARAAAQLRLATANKALDEAKKTRSYRQYRNGSDAMVQNAQADLILANDALERAQNAYNGVSGQSDDSVTKAGALSALSAAQKARDRAVANLNYLQAMPNPLEVSLVEAQLQAAQAEADAAQRALDKLQDGVDPDALALAEQRVKNAEAQLSASQAALGDAELTAPFDAIVAARNADPGTWVAPGQPMLSLADVAHLRVRTTDLSERDVPTVTVGQSVRVTIKALGIDLAGKVREVAPLADTLGGDVVYPTTIDLLEAPPPTLRAGMSVDVRFLSKK